MAKRAPLFYQKFYKLFKASKLGSVNLHCYIISCEPIKPYTMDQLDLSLLRTLCAVHAPSANEEFLTQFILNYVKTNAKTWRVQPKVLAGHDLHDNVVLVFGKPRTAVFAHLDSIGFTTRYGTELIRIGSPAIESGWPLAGTDSLGEVEATLVDENGEPHYKSVRPIDRGTTLTFKCDFRETGTTVQSCYLDNRLGVWVALKLAETIENGVLVFSTREEHMGGAVSYIAGKLWNDYGVRQALICDITWVTEGVEAGKGVAISMRDSSLPRKSFVNRIVALATESKVAFQLEVEGSGGSDGTELQRSPWPFDWCFVGAPEINAHTPHEQVHKADIISMLEMYRWLLTRL